MLTAVLPHEKQSNGLLTQAGVERLRAEHMATLLRDRQHTDLTTAMARKPVKPKGDRITMARQS